MMFESQSLIPVVRRCSYGRARRAAAAFLTLAALASTGVAQTITNGDLNGLADFQTYNTVVPPGWTAANPTPDLFHPTTTVAQLAWQTSVGGGTFIHCVGFDPNTEAVSQVVTGLTVGTTYEIQFEQACSNSVSAEATGAFWRVSFGTVIQDAAQMTIPALGVPFAWQPQSMYFVATATAQTLKFEAHPIIPSTLNFTASLGVDTIQISVGCAGIPGFEFVTLGVPPNPFALLPGLSGPPTIGAVWDPVIDHTSFVPTAVLDVFLFSLLPANIPTPPLGTILCSPALAFFTRQPGNPLNLLIPNDCNLSEVRLCVSGLSIDANGDLFLTNAIQIVIGS